MVEAAMSVTGASNCEHGVPLGLGATIDVGAIG